MRFGYWLLLGVLGAGCASASLGVDDEAVPVSLDRVVWNDAGSSGHHGVLTLVEDVGSPPEIWQLHLEVQDTVFEERRELDMGRLPVGSRVYLIAPGNLEYRGRLGPFSLSRRGGGALDGVFALPGESPTLELTLAWTSWHVSDRRLLTGGRDGRDDNNSLAE